MDANRTMFILKSLASDAARVCAARTLVNVVLAVAIPASPDRDE